MPRDARTRGFLDFFAGLTVTVLVTVGVVVYDAVEHFDASRFFVAESWVPIVGTAASIAAKTAVTYMISYVLRALRATPDAEPDEHGTEP